MTALDLRRRVAIALATIVAACACVAAPALAEPPAPCTPSAGTNCVGPVKTAGVAAGADAKNADGTTITTTKYDGSSFFDDVTNFMLTWLPLIFMGIICLLIG